MTDDNPWLFSLSQLTNTPSRLRGMSAAEENRQRRTACKIIRDVSTLLNIRNYKTVATASVFFHRFFILQAMQDFSPARIALASLFLAGKVEETPKKCKDLLTAAKERFPEYYAQDTTNSIVHYEKRLLHTIRFDVEVIHPYEKIIEYVKVFEMDRDEKSFLSTTAWTFINDSFCTTLCLTWPAELIAIAVLEMALCMGQSMHKLERRYRQQDEYPLWWEHFVGNTNQKTVDLICHQLLDYYWLVENEDAAGTIQTLMKSKCIN